MPLYRGYILQINYDTFANEVSRSTDQLIYIIYDDKQLEVGFENLTKNIIYHRHACIIHIMYINYVPSYTYSVSCFRSPFPRKQTRGLSFFFFFL